MDGRPTREYSSSNRGDSSCRGPSRPAGAPVTSAPSEEPGYTDVPDMKVHLTTLGCPKNQVDSELMLGMLTEAGFPLAARPEDAECLIVNTCAFIDRAREESVATILELARLKETGRCRALIVTGCLTQRYGGEILREMPEVDGILGTSNLTRIVDLVRQAANRHDWATSAPPGYLYDATTPRLLSATVPYAYVKIAEGCDMGCTFCAIPQFRGRHRSRPRADIVREVEALAARGVQEAIPDLAVRTTVLVGFPGESEAAFQHLLEFLDAVRFDRLGVFTYSPEEGTPSPGFPDQVDAEVAAERAAIVQDLQDRIVWEENAKLVGTVTDVLVDGPSEDPAFAFEGRTAGQAPEIDGVVYLRGRFEPGRFARASIVEVEGHELVGERA